MTSRLRILAAALGAAATFGLTACSSFEDNNGSRLTTAENQSITESMILGKWDVDGERTNTANGNSGVGAIPSDVLKDVFGEGYRFEGGGVLRTDRTVGAQVGRWRLEGANEIVIQEDPSKPEQRFVASFRDGYMYWKQSDGRWVVLERDKFFGI